MFEKADKKGIKLDEKGVNPIKLEPNCDNIDSKESRVLRMIYCIIIIFSFLTIYDKADRDTITAKEIATLLQDLEKE